MHRLRYSLITLLSLLLVLPVRGQKSDAFDDVLQHVPMASVVVLKTLGVDNNSTWLELLGSCAATYVVGAGVTYGLKHGVNEMRPDKSDRRSFPSGHTMFAFAGATTLRHEFGKASPWITVGGYGLATFVAIDRVRQDRHYIHDVLAGAAIGVLSSELTYYLRRKLIKNTHLDVSFTGTQLSLAYTW